MVQLIQRQWLEESYGRKRMKKYDVAAFDTENLEPDDLYGYGYLEAVKKVFIDRD